MLIIDRYLEGGAERVGVGTAGGVFAVDGFNGDAVDWLKFSLEKVMQDAEVFLHLRVVAWHIEFQRLAIPLGYHDNPASPIDEVCAGNTFGQRSFDGVKLDAAH